MITVILISGKYNAGKDTLAQSIFDTLLYHQTSNISVHIDSLAAPVKEIAADYMFWDGKKDDVGRDLLVGIAKTAADYYRYTWIHRLANRIRNVTEPSYSYETNNFIPKDLHSIYIIPDFRFIHEIVFLAQDDIAKHINYIIPIRVGRINLPEMESKHRENVFDTELDSFNHFKFILDWDEGDEFEDYKNKCNNLSLDIADLALIQSEECSREFWQKIFTPDKYIEILHQGNKFNQRIPEF